MPGTFSHIDKRGQARMVDIGSKDTTERTARACGIITMKKETLQRIVDKNIPKGDVFAAARIAGIQAAKRTPNLIPLCHPLPIDSVNLDIKAAEGDSPTALILESTVTGTAKTGFEMEALTAVSIAALTIYDMCKSIDRGMEITGIYLAYKSGGKSGVYKKRE